jgi:hypothetical protein
MGDLGDRLRKLEHVRAHSFTRLRRAIDVSVDRITDGLFWLLSHVRPSLARARRAIDVSVDRITDGPLSRVGAFVAVERAIAATANPLRGLRWRLRSTRLGRSADGIIVLPLLAIALVLGVFAATAATNASSTTPRSGSAPPASGTDATSDEVVTETITRKGKTLRIIRYKTKPGRVVVDTVSGRSVTIPGRSVTVRGSAVTLPGDTRTVHETRTVRETVTDVVTETEVVVSTETQFVTTTVDEPQPD